MADQHVFLEASVISLADRRETITFKRRADRNEVIIVVETLPALPTKYAQPIQHALLVSAIALRSAALVVLDGPDAPQH